MWGRSLLIQPPYLLFLCQSEILSRCKHKVNYTPFSWPWCFFFSHSNRKAAFRVTESLCDCQGAGGCFQSRSYSESFNLHVLLMRRICFKTRLFMCVGHVSATRPMWWLEDNWRKSVLFSHLAGPSGVWGGTHSIRLVSKWLDPSCWPQDHCCFYVCLVNEELIYLEGDSWSENLNTL